MQVGVYKSKENPQLRRGILTFILSALLVLGMCLLLYPSFSNWFNEGRQTTVITEYSEEVNSLTEEQYNKMLEDAQAYNQTLADRGYTNFVLSTEENEEYESVLNLSGVMSYIEIPSIRVNLPIYHGTSDEVLQVGVGHIAGSSLPVGGESTHCVLSGHRGLPSSKLFTDIDQLTIGDVFVLHTLNEEYTYEVDQVLIVDPDDVSALQIVEGEDLCTLVTCTPYGINSHRLLVRGHRIANLTDYSNLTGDASQIEPILVAPFAGIPVLTLLLYMVLRKPKAEAAAEDAAADSAEKTGMAGRARKHHGPARLLDLLRHLFDRGGPGPDDPSPGGGAAPRGRSARAATPTRKAGGAAASSAAGAGAGDVTFAGGARPAGASAVDPTRKAGGAAASSAVARGTSSRVKGGGSNKDASAFDGQGKNAQPEAPGTGARTNASVQPHFAAADVRGRASQAGTIFDGDTAGAAGLTGTTNGRAGARTPRKDA
jgi:sortase A